MQHYCMLSTPKESLTCEKLVLSCKIEFAGEFNSSFTEKWGWTLVTRQLMIPVWFKLVFNVPCPLSDQQIKLFFPHFSSVALSVNISQFSYFQHFIFSSLMWLIVENCTLNEKITFADWLWNNSLTASVADVPATKLRLLLLVHEQWKVQENYRSNNVASNYWQSYC